MKALMKMAEGPGHMELVDIPMPEIGDDDLLLKVSCCGVCGSDLHIEDWVHPCKPPVVLGHEFAGVVAGTGKNVTGFAEGDAVAFRRGWSPYPGTESNGGFGEYMRAPARCMWHTPEGITQAEASQFETLVTPARAVRDLGEVRPGDCVVVTGVGMIGLGAVAIAAIEGAEVWAMGTESDLTERLPISTHVGAARTLVFGEEALAEIEAWGPRVWIEASGAATAVEAASNLVAKGGTIVSPGLGSGPWNVNVGRMSFNNISLLGMWGGNIAHLDDIAGWMQEGRLDIKPMLQAMPLSEWREAFDMLRRQEGVKVVLEPVGPA